MQSFDIGETVVLTSTVTVEGDATVTVGCTVRPPTGALVTLSVDVVSGSTYRARYVPSQPGMHTARWVALAGSESAVDEFTFQVRRSAVL